MECKRVLSGNMQAYGVRSPSREKQRKSVTRQTKPEESEEMFLTQIERNKSTVSYFSTDIDDVEDDDDDDWDNPREKPDLDAIKKRLYTRECQKLKVTPIGAFVREPTKTELILKYYSMGEKGARALAIPLMLDSTLNYLDLEGNSIGPAGLSSLVEMLTDNICLSHLNLARNNLGSAGANMVCFLLLKNRFITTLDLSGNGFRDSDAEVFAEVLKENRYLKELFLAENEFGEICGSTFGEALTKSKKQHIRLMIEVHVTRTSIFFYVKLQIAINDILESLDLSWNHMRMKSITSLCNGLKNNTALKTLNLSFNGCSREGTMSMGEALSSNSALKELDMSHNRLVDKDVEVLATCFKNNDTLSVLKLGSNLLSAVGSLTLIKAIQKAENSGIEVLDITHICVFTEFENIVKDIQKIRPFKVIHDIIVHTPKDVNPAPQSEKVSEDEQVEQKEKDTE